MADIDDLKAVFERLTDAFSSGDLEGFGSFIPDILPKMRRSTHRFRRFLLMEDYR
jgi:hypothetical protein